MASTFFTIFTSTFNREHTIHRVWESLINQTNKNFEWIIIDNGSQDNIRPLLEDYKLKADFDVKLIFQENQGKFMAFNRAVDLARGELFIPADSDDRFEPNTIQFFKDNWAKFKSENISGINVLCKYANGKIVGEKYPLEGISCFKDIVYKYKVGGEKWGCVRTDILRAHKFPSHYKVKLLPDYFVWAPIGLKYKTVYLNEPLRLYYVDAGNQLTHQKDVSIQNMEMKNDYTLWEINYILPQVKRYLSLKDKAQKYVSLWLTTFKSKRSIPSILKKIDSWDVKLVASLFIIPSFIINIFGLQLNFLKKKKYEYQIQSK